MSSSEAIEAVVQVGARATPYLRCGRGRSVLVLAADRPGRQRLVERLAVSYRVIAPEPPPPDEPAVFQQWVRELIEGLGLEQPLVALSRELAHHAPLLRAACGDVLDLPPPVPPDGVR